MMKNRFILLVLLGALALPSWAAADVWSAFSNDGSVRNTISFTNWEVILRGVDEPSDPQSPPEGVFQLADDNWYTKVLTPEEGDIAVQILSATKVSQLVGGGENPSWQQGVDGGQITAYLVQEVMSAPAGGPFRFGAASVDPFGVFSGAQLAAGFAASLYRNDVATFGNAPPSPVAPGAVGSQLVTDVGNIITGSWFASFGFGEAIDTGFAAENTSLTGTLKPGGVDVKGGFNVLAVANPQSVFPGVINPDPLGLVFGGTTSMSLEANIEQIFVGAWDFRSTDPWIFKVTPEPGSLAALAGMGLMGLAIALRRRRQEV